MPGALREGPPVSATDVVPAEPVLNEGFDLLEWAKKPMVDLPLSGLLEYKNCVLVRETYQDHGI